MKRVSLSVPFHAKRRQPPPDDQMIVEESLSPVMIVTADC